MENKKEFSWQKSTNNTNTHAPNLKINKGGRPKTDIKKVQFTVKINHVLAKKMEEYSESTGFGWTTIFEQALQEFFKNN